MKPRRSRALMAERPKLFDYDVDIPSKIKACQNSGVELTLGERGVLEDWQQTRSHSKGMYKIFWKICRKCGVT